MTLRVLGDVKVSPGIRSEGQANGWSRRRAKKAARLARIARWMNGSVLKTAATVEALQALIEPGDNVALEGNNQKQADFLSRALVQADPGKLHDLHLLIGSVSRPEHLTLFERGIARKLDLSFAGPQSVRLAQLLEDGKLEIGAIHTYVELYARMFVDLMPDVALVCAEQADRQGNLYTGPNTEDTPTIVEATAFHDGVVVVQVNAIVDELPRVDIPVSWVDVVVAADRPFQVEPLFTRDPRLISELQILLGMLVIRGIYERHGVTTLNHGIGFDTAAVELLLPTYGRPHAWGSPRLACRVGPVRLFYAVNGNRVATSGLDSQPFLRSLHRSARLCSKGIVGRHPVWLMMRRMSARESSGPFRTWRRGSTHTLTDRPLRRTSRSRPSPTDRD